jgi:mono/diheme cytochrome c family protein
MVKRTIHRNYAILACLLALAGCGGAANRTPLPTVTPIPTFQFVQPTEAPQIVTVAVETATAGSSMSVAPSLIEAGKGRYTALQCGSCHAEDGQGTDKGPALAGTTLTQDEFINVLRTGGKLGNEHLYSTNRLSDAGGKNLYLYVLSLPK